MGNPNRSLSRFAAVTVACAAVALLTQCNKNTTAPRQIATSNLSVAANANVLSAVNATPLTFQNAGDVFDPGLANQTFTLTFSNTSSGTPSAAIVFPNLTNSQFTADVTFGSCIFTVKASTTGFLTVGKQIKIDPCTLNAATGGATINQTTNSNVSLLLGSKQSVVVPLPLTVHADGTVTFGSNTLGTVNIGVVTGG